MITIPESRETAGAGTDREWHALRSEHAALGAAARRLEDLLRSLAADPFEQDGWAQARTLLGEFHARFFDHLATEEGDGILERAAAYEPRFERRVELLRREHVDLRARMSALVIDVAEEGWGDVHRRFVSFLGIFRAHERAENEVLQRAYLEDLGGRG